MALVKKEIVLHKKVYSFKNDDGEKVEGAEILILADYVKDDVNEGRKVAKAKIPYEIALKMEGLPAIYNINYDVRVDRESRLSLVPVDAKFFKPFDFTIE